MTFYMNLPIPAHRYSRQINLPQFGLEAQNLLKKASVLVVGAGGLGCPVLQYLVATGVGKIVVMDDDKVDITNLHRQVLYNEEDIGHLKSHIAYNKLQKVNTEVVIEYSNQRLTSENAKRFIAEHQVVVDGSDNFATRYLVNDTCVLLNKPFVFGSVYQYKGQASVFNFNSLEGKKSPTYRCLYPHPPNPETVPNCETGGVLGPLVGIIGSMMALETIKIITGIGQVLSGRLLIVNGLDFTIQEIQFDHNPDIIITELIDYEEFCDIKKNMEISVKEFKKLQSNGTDIQLIDIRQGYEYDYKNIGGINIPLTDMDFMLGQIGNHIVKTKKAIIHCSSGVNSKIIVEILRASGNENVFSLEGGIEAYLK